MLTIDSNREDSSPGSSYALSSPRHQLKPRSGVRKDQPFLASLRIKRINFSLGFSNGYRYGTICGWIENGVVGYRIEYGLATPSDWSKKDNPARHEHSGSQIGSSISLLSARSLAPGSYLCHATTVIVGLGDAENSFVGVWEICGTLWDIGRAMDRDGRTPPLTHPIPAVECAFPALSI